MSTTSLPHAVDAALTPELALRYLRELATDLAGAVVLRPDGHLLAGSPELGDAGRALVDVSGAAAVAQARHAGRLVTVARSGTHVLLAVHTRHALPGLVRHDLRAVLGDLASDGDPPADTPAAPLTVSPAALGAVVRAAEASARAPSGGRRASGGRG